MAHIYRMAAARQPHAHSAGEMGRALRRRHALQRGQQLAVVGAVVAMHARIARRIHPRRAVQRVYAQAGIICNGGLLARLADGLGLDGGVFFKRGAGFFRLQQHARLALRKHGVAHAHQNAAHFGQLVGVVGSCDKFHLTPQI